MSQARTRLLSPQLLVVAPLRRATQTGLLAFEGRVSAAAAGACGGAGGGAGGGAAGGAAGGASLPAVAHELCHERAGRHTCDKRLGRAALAAAYPEVSYDLIESEEDPYWADGVTREPCDLPVES